MHLLSPIHLCVTFLIHRLRISTSIYPIPSICYSDQMGDWFESLASCLNWNVRKAQKPMRQVPSLGSVEWNSNGSTSNGEH